MTTRDRVKKLTDQLEAGLQKVWTTDHYLSYLKTMARFHNYSLLNSLLIYLQLPSASYVAGYSTWQTKFHRHVKKGEKGIRILAPIPYTITETDENGVETQSERITYHPATVFDVTQTEGKPLPTICDPLSANVDDYTMLLGIVMSLTDAEIRFAPSHVRGYYRPADHVIVIDEMLSEADKIKTLLHEIAHSVLHSETGPEHDADSQTKEIQAESVAYIVCQYLGIDSTQYATEYITSWATTKKSDVLKSNLMIIQKTAVDFIDKMETLLQAYK